jgi:hypothetical protein
MPKFQIHVVNSDFEASNEVEAPDMAAARMYGLKGALDIGADEVCKGETQFFGAEVRVEVDGEVKQRFMVGIGQTPLI